MPGLNYKFVKSNAAFCIKGSAISQIRYYRLRKTMCEDLKRVVMEVALNVTVKFTKNNAKHLLVLGVAIATLCFFGVSDEIVRRYPIQLRVCYIS